MLYPVLRDMNNWLDNDFDDMLNTSWMPRMNVTAPAINVKENDKEYEVELAAPGTTKDDFKVNVDKDGNLTIKMEHKDEKKDENKKEHYLRREFSYSNYEQALTLPEDVEKDKIEAKVNNGAKADDIMTLAMLTYISSYSYSRLARWQRYTKTPSAREMSPGDITRLTQSIPEKDRQALLGTSSFGKNWKDGTLCC